MLAQRSKGSLVKLFAQFVYLFLLFLVVFFVCRTLVTDYLTLPEPLSSLFPPMITLLILSVYVKLSKHPGQSGILDLPLSPSTVENAIVVLFVICAAAVATIPPTDNAVWIDWGQIGSLAWMRAIASLLIMSFLPGYFILGNLSFRRALSIYEVVALSHVLSSFFTTSLVLVAISLGVGVAETLPITILGCSALLAIRLLRRKMARGSPPLIRIRFDHANASIIALLMIFTIFSYSYMYHFIYGDQWTYHGEALLLYRNGTPPPIDGGFAFYTTWWFALYLATFFAHSGLPSANAYYMLNIMNPILLLSFYAMLLSFFERRGDESRKIPLMATMFVVFSGFGWIFCPFVRARYPASDPWKVLSLLGGQTYDVWIPNNMSILASHPDITTVLQLMSLPSLFLFVSMLGDPPFKSKSITFTATVLSIQIFIAHVTEMPWLVGVLILIAMLPVEKSDSHLHKLRDVSMGVLASLVITMLMDVVSPFGRLYTVEPYLSILLLSVLGILLSLLITFLRTRGSPLRHALTSRSGGPMGKISLISVVVAAYVFGLSLVIVSEIYSHFHVAFTIDQRTLWSFVPWYYYPMRLGIVGVLAIAGLAMARKRIGSDYHYQVFLAWSVVSILLGVFVGRISHSYDEFRLVRFLGAGLSVFASLALIRIVTGLNRARVGVPIRTLVGVSLIACVTILGLSSTLLYTRHQRLVAKSSFTPRFNVLRIANYLAPRLELDDGVTWPRGGEKFDISFCLMGMWNGRTVPRHLFFGANSPEQIFTAAHADKLRYIYMTEGQLKGLPNNTYINFLSRHLPAIHEDTGILIFQAYNFTPPSPNASLRVLRQPFPSDGVSTDYVVLSAISLAGVKYDVGMVGDTDLSDVSTIVLPYDPASRSDYTDFLLQWVEGGGSLIVVDGGKGVFKSEMGLEVSKQSTDSNGIQGVAGYSPLPSVKVKKIPRHGGSVLASYTYNGEDVVPFVIRKGHGKGNLYFLHLGPIVSALDSLPPDGSVQLFQTLGRLPFHLDMKLQGYESTNGLASTLDFLIGETEMEGEVVIETDSVYFDDRMYPIRFGSLTIGHSGHSVRYGNGKITSFFARGRVDYTITTGVATLKGGTARYSVLELDLPNSWSVDVDDESAIYMVVEDANGKSEPMVVSNATIEVENVSPSTGSVLLRSPIIETRGVVYFPSAWLHKPSQDRGLDLLIFRDSPDKFELWIRGRIKLAPSLSSRGLIFLSGFSYDGTLDLPKKVRNEWDLPWEDILKSPISVGYHALFALSLVLCMLWSRRRVHK